MDMTATEQPEVKAMNIVRSEQAVGLIRQALTDHEDDNLENVSFMLSPNQRAVVRQLARENRMSQGVIMRIVLDEWMETKLNGH